MCRWLPSSPRPPSALASLLRGFVRSCAPRAPEMCMPSRRRVQWELMQIMPETWAVLRRRYGLGADPYDAHDNIIAGAAYLRELHDRYGFPGFLADTMPALRIGKITLRRVASFPPRRALISPASHQSSIAAQPTMQSFSTPSYDPGPMTSLFPLHLANAPTDSQTAPNPSPSLSDDQPRRESLERASAALRWSVYHPLRQGAIMMSPSRHNRAVEDSLDIRRGHPARCLYQGAPL